MTSRPLMRVAIADDHRRRLGDARIAQAAQLPLEHAAPANIKEAFGHALGQRQEPAALASAERKASK